MSCMTIHTRSQHTCIDCDNSGAGKLSIDMLNERTQPSSMAFVCISIICIAAATVASHDNVERVGRYNKQSLLGIHSLRACRAQATRVASRALPFAPTGLQQFNACGGNCLNSVPKNWRAPVVAARSPPSFHKEWLDT